MGDLSLIPGLRRSPEEGKGYPLQNSMDCIVHAVAKSRMRLSDFHFFIFIYIFIRYIHSYKLSFSESLFVKNPLAMQETPVPFLGQEDPLGKG